jgi:hypothetical protein
MIFRNGLLGFCLVLFCSYSFADQGEITFSGEKYQVAYSKTVDGVKLTEYLRPHETLKEWRQMITVQEHPGASRIADVMNPYAAARKRLYLKDVQLYTKNNEVGFEDAIFEFLLKSPDGSFMEFTLVRAVAKTGQPVVLYILSKKITFKEESVMAAELKEAYEMRRVWFPALGKMSFDGLPK